MIRHRSSVSKAGQQKSGLSTRASRKAKPSGWRSKVNCFEQLESRALLAADAFQNSANLFDVNGDGHVSPLDALAIINDLNKNGTHSLTTLASDFATPATQSVTAQASGTQASPTLFEDVNGDGVVSPLDALKVINALNSNDVAQVTLIATDMNGVPLASVPVGTVFELEALVADVSGNAANGVGTSIASGGVFEAEIDATLSSTTVAKLDPSSTVTYGPNFVTLDSSGHPLTGTNGQVSDLSQASAGKIIGTGAFGGLTPPGPGQKVLWSIPVLASATGLETFTPSAGTGLNNEIAIYDTSGNHDNALDPATQVDFEAGSVQVVPANAAIISIAPASVVRSTSTTTTEVFNVTLANPSTTQTTTVNWSTSPGTALAGVDYTSASGTLSFAPGATSGQITVQIPASAKYNPSSTFTVNLSNAVNASIGTTQAIGTITTNVAPPVFTIASPPSVVRPTSAETTVEVFTVTLTGATEAYAAVNYSTANGVSPNGAVANVDYTPTSGQLVFQPGTTTETITVPILPNSVATGNLNFFLTSTSPTNSTIQFGGGQATGTITPPPTVDLSITKNDNKSGTSAGTVGNVTPGTALTYTITVANNGSSTATGATITDNFPAGITSESWSAIGTGGASGFATSGTTNINNTVTMPAGSTIVYTVIANVSASATGTLSNTATVTVPAGVTDTNPANNMATDVDNLVPTADLSITKIDNKGGSSINNTTGSVVPGSQITYFITVSNNGPLAATGVAVSDIFPAGLSAESWTAASTGTATATGFTPSGSGNITDPALNLPSGASVTYTVLATVANSASGTLTNIATVTGPNTPIDPVSTNNSATDSDTVVQTADLSITKVDNHNGSSITHTTGTAVPGTAVTYTIVATNNGPSAVNGVKVMDTLPAGFIISDSWSATATGGATGFTTTPSTGAINDTINMPANSTVTYTVVANISPSATGTLTNTATITAPAGVSDASGNNSATDSDTLTPTADLSITKSDNKSGSSSGSTGSVTPGNPIIYTIVVSNSGPSAATGVKVVDNMPAGISSDSWTATPSGGATGFTAASNGNINDQAVNLPSGSSITYTVMANVSGSASGTLSNTATVTAASGTTDPNGANNTAIDVDNLVPTADLSITKSDNVGGSSSLNTTGTTSPGSTITYTIVVSNAGPVEADGVTIKDLLPAGITSDTYTASATGGATGFSSGLSGAINDTAVNMPSGSKVTYIVTAVTDPAASGLISNIATVAAPAGITDPNLANNSATDKVNLVPLTDLSITKTDNVGGSSTANTIGTATNGGSITYTIVVTNSGPANATGAKIIDTLPAAFSSATYTASATGGATGFTTGVSGSISDTVNMPVDSTITYIVTANLASNFAGTVSNTAMVSAPSGDNDPNTANNSATDTDTVPGIADLVVTKSDNKGGASSGSVGTVIPGQQMTYTIMVTNNGPSDVTGATIADSLPAGISSATYSATATGGATGFKASGTGSINDTAVNMPVGSTVTYTVTANVNSAATGTLSNTATASLPAGFTDPQPSNNTATDSDNLTPTADLSITKVDNHGGSSVANTVGNVVKGQTITYTIVVTNTGPDAATGVSVVDTLPAAISGDSFTAVTTGGATGFTASGSGNISDANVTLPAGSTVTYVVTATISATTTATTMSNTATVTAGAGVADGNSANNSATDTDNIAVFTPSSLSGIEYIDSDGNGLKGTSELAVQNATIKLTGTDFLNASVNLTTNTAADGSYTFGNLNPGTYTITSVQSSMLTAGQAFGGSEAGTVLDANDIKVTIGPAGGIIGTGNNFTEKSFASAAISERILLASAHLNGTVNLNDTSLFPSTATSSVASPQVTPSVTSASLLASNAVSAPNATSAVDAAFADPDLLD